MATALGSCKRAIDRFKELRRACEVRALTKMCKRKFDEIARAEDVNSNNKKCPLSFGNLGTNAHFSNHQVINLDLDDEGEIKSAYPGKGGMFHMYLDQKHLKCSVRGNAPVSMALMAQSEPREKCVFTWSLDMRRRFCDAVDALGGPLVATPKKIKELMNVADVTEEDIKSHMLLQNYRPAQAHNTCSMVSRDVLKMGKTVIQSGSQALHIGESSNGQVAAAAAAAGRGTSGGWGLVCRASDLLPSMREMLVQSGAVEMPESSRRQMAAVSQNGGWKLVSEKYINGPMNKKL